MILLGICSFDIKISSYNFVSSDLSNGDTKLCRPSAIMEEEM